jgi:hypothetical protein
MSAADELGLRSQPVLHLDTFSTYCKKCYVLLSKSKMSKFICSGCLTSEAGCQEKSDEFTNSVNIVSILKLANCLSTLLHRFTVSRPKKHSSGLTHSLYVRNGCVI